MIEHGHPSDICRIRDLVHRSRSKPCSRKRRVAASEMGLSRGKALTASPVGSC
ncbi:hypothetical protein J3R73_003482 [Labrys monachus]|uniref:Uncharacterized protein n=1 Tax=Labrys monachus TaxID=217067 RepID=A0ABU0FHZ2_9HYPH|nr:hypothetical protein [Labrys monachus]